MHSQNFSHSALIMVDVQNDFCAGGALAVPDGDAVVPAVNAISGRFDIVVATQDWHPAGHISFASSHPGKKPHEAIPWNDDLQMLWPDHCTAGTRGAAFHPGLDIDVCRLILRKGTSIAMDSYSAFFENDHRTPTGLEGYLRTMGMGEVVFCGLAFDYCVLYSALDAVRLGFSVAVFEAGVRGVDVPVGSMDSARRVMIEAGIKII